MGKTHSGGERESGRVSPSPEYHIWGSLLLLDGFPGKKKTTQHSTRQEGRNGNWPRCSAQIPMGQLFSGLSF